ncbi:MAG: hypothetical protein EHM72_20035 [Calditrichaeota bacterium]|nr:MAG: hypothetical protein EHM72_20035 [Calditrichota bacterium]
MTGDHPQELIIIRPYAFFSSSQAGAWDGGEKVERSLDTAMEMGTKTCLCGFAPLREPPNYPVENPDQMVYSFHCKSDLHRNKLLIQLLSERDGAGCCRVNLKLLNESIPRCCFHIWFSAADGRRVYFWRL